MIFASIRKVKLSSDVIWDVSELVVEHVLFCGV
jgi:hypothetical protein